MRLKKEGKKGIRERNEKPGIRLKKKKKKGGKE